MIWRRCSESFGGSARERSSARRTATFTPLLGPLHSGVSRTCSGSVPWESAYGADEPAGVPPLRSAAASGSPLYSGKAQPAERVGFEPTCPALHRTKRFRGAPVTATSVPLRAWLSSVRRGQSAAAFGCLRSRKNFCSSSRPSSARTPETTVRRCVSSRPSSASFDSTPPNLGSGGP